MDETLIYAVNPKDPNTYVFQLPHTLVLQYTILYVLWLYLELC